MNDTNAPDPMRVGILGAGPMARHHAQALTRLPVLARVCAIVDPSAEARESLGKEHEEADLFATFEEALATTSLDAVHVCTPPATHAELARQALSAGCHVYVEKPFATNVDEAREVLELARARNRHCCAGHQLLFERPTRDAMRLLPALGHLVHVESYFSFRQVRTGREGGAALPTILQLLDILPHPVYLLLAILEEAVPGDRTDLRQVEVGRGGTVHALVRRGDLAASLVVTLTGRPVETTLRLVGSNGTLMTDYVRGTVQRLVGPGSSSVDKMLQPFRLARQLVIGSIAALSGRLFRRQRSYPGLRETFEAFYLAARVGSTPPMSPESILETVKLCQEIEEVLRKAKSEQVFLEEADTRRRVLVTGGTGFLGRHVAKALRSHELSPVVVARRDPPPWDRIRGVKYVTVDLAEGISPRSLRNIDTIVHCAAETAGGWSAHARNTISATEHLLRSAAEAGVSRFIHVSSLAVVHGAELVNETSPILTARNSGAYVWGKAQSELLARDLAPELAVDLKVVRPGPLVEWSALDPPGRLGKRLGNLYVAVGAPRDQLGVIDVRHAAESIAWICSHFERAPKTIHLIDPNLPTKGQLLAQLRALNPGLRVIWLPRALLTPLSLVALFAQKLFRRHVQPLNLSDTFRVYRYDVAQVKAFLDQIQVGV